MLRRSILIIIMLSSAFAPSLLFGSAGEDKPDGAVYELSSEANYQEGCVSPCTCPVKVARLSGTFRLANISTLHDLLIESRLDEISWLVTAYDGKLVHRITGGGIYQRAGKKHRLILDISIDGNKAHFDTDFVPDGTRFPTIKILVDQGARCFDTWINIDASPRK